MDSLGEGTMLALNDVDINFSQSQEPCTTYKYKKNNIHNRSSIEINCDNKQNDSKNSNNASGDINLECYFDDSFEYINSQKSSQNKSNLLKKFSAKYSIKSKENIEEFHSSSPIPSYKNKSIVDTDNDHNNSIKQNVNTIDNSGNPTNISGLYDIDWNTENVSFSQLSEKQYQNDIQNISSLVDEKVLDECILEDLFIQSGLTLPQHNLSSSILNNSQKSFVEDKVLKDTTNIDTNEVYDKSNEQINISTLNTVINDSCPKVNSSILKTSQTLPKSNLETSHKHEESSLNINSSNTTRDQTSHNIPNSAHNCDKLLLSNWGLPPQILQEYANHRIKKLFQWQVDCLDQHDILHERKNLIYSAPTSAGKTLVSEILLIKTVLERHKKVLVILPFVSIVREKMFYFQDILGSSGIRVSGFMGSHAPAGGFQATHVAVCTIEKANSIINRALSDESLGDIGAIIIDELHLVGDPDRGYILELLLTKVRYICEKDKSLKMQLIGMSATLPNLPLLAKWLDASLYQTDFRPIPLEEQYKIDECIYNYKNEFIRKMVPHTNFPRDPDNVIQLCLETIMDSCSVLIFCPTKMWCENLAQQIAKAFMQLLNATDNAIGKKLQDELNKSAINELIEQLKNCPVGLDSVLKNTVSYGCAFHHAGLTMDERDIIEGGFKSNALRVLVATSTLSSGVNLPARRVLIRTPIFHGQSLKSLTYRQMIGRAGRMGKDTKGESILICNKKDASVAKKLISENEISLQSCLVGRGKLERAILEVIASGRASSLQDLEIFTKSTLFSVLVSKNEMSEAIKSTVDFLIKYELVRQQDTNEGDKLWATPLGQACLASSMPPEDGLMLFTELDKARQCFVLDTDLHMIYLVTPYSICSQLGNIDWLLALDLWEELSPNMRRVGELVGVQESFLVKAIRGTLKLNCPQMYHKMQIHRRFYTALALQELVNEVPLQTVAEKFRCSRGVLQSLQQSAATFAGMVTSFIHQLGWDSMEILISQFQQRLQFGIQRDLIDLMRLPLLNGQRARAIFKAGIENLMQLATSDPCALENILYNSMPFLSTNNQEESCEDNALTKNNVRCIWVNGKAGLTTREAADLLILHARKYLEVEMGSLNIDWNKHNSNDTVNTSENLSSTDTSNREQNTDNIITQVAKNDTACKKDDFREREACSDNSLISSLNLSDRAEDNEQFSDISMNGDNKKNGVKRVKTEAKKQTVTRSVKRKSESPDAIGIKRLSLDDAVVGSQDEISGPEETTKLITKTTPKNPSTSVQSQRYSEYKVLKIISKIKFINVTKSLDDFLEFCTNIRSEEKISVTIVCDTIPKSENIIGKKFTQSQRIDESKYNCIVQDRFIQGFYIYCGKTELYYLSLQNTLVDENITLKHRLDILRIIFNSKSRCLIAYNCKSLVKLVFYGCQLEIKCNLRDPKVADWILNTRESTPTLEHLIKSYLANFIKLSKQLESRIKVSSNCIMQWFLYEVLFHKLSENTKMYLSFTDIEMPSVACIAKMEVSGICLNCKDLQKLNCIVEDKMQKLQNEAYKLTGRRFNMSSSKEVAKVLGIFNGKKVSTNKQVLETLNTPISNLIMIWRKLENTLTKIIYPLLRNITSNNRLHGHFIMQTATGRIVMSEPNIQNVPKDFAVDDELKNLSCRSIFSSKDGYRIVSADYRQLEFRILTHLSEDPILCDILKSNKDVFKSISAQWNNVSEDEVDDVMRQRTKQLIYGMIYGMGTKALSHTLNVTELDALTFLESFNRAYPVLHRYTKSVIQKCSETGFVETIKGRRRYLPNINQSSRSLKGQAERQALNTTIQGSAADISKIAMVKVDTFVSKKIEQCSQFSNSDRTAKFENDSICLMLHMHDELIYEVQENCVEEFVKILKDSMENAFCLNVPLPVNIKVGDSWGSMKDYNV
ncbi:LOW QUALITY PROTEIN: DNA polymerase theta-like [Ctenocephalides felis]|uniref:LOW QUALITY PROTEIN: DNA polymerase theta-like n=1 Tax=Ctenocephalides felis TaxID=7515 RepID=UPI000E6E44BC|nr:LOW QUALITY PROTEIN: DNA polymerase theta-like [Ctenocephalides felis]